MRNEKSISDYPFPFSPELEYQVLGDFIQNADIRNEVIKIVTPPMFEGKESRGLWLNLIDRHSHNEPIDIVSVRAYANQKFLADNIMMRCEYCGYISAQTHALALQDQYIKREIYKSCIESLEGITNGMETEELLSISKRVEDTINTNTSTSDMVSLSDSLDELMTDLENNKNKRIKTGIPTIDQYCNGGFGNGQLIVVGARPASGKTSLSLDWATKMAKNGYKGCFFTIEMTNKDLALKTMLGTGEICMFDIIREQKEWDRLERALSMARTPNLYISKRCTTITQIMNKITTMHQDGKCDIAFIDYLQLIRGYGKDLRERMTNITGSLKQLALDLEIPIVLMSQLNRNSTNENRRPISSDLKESGATEQDADVIILLERPRKKDENGNDIQEEIQNRIDAYLDKNRGGSICTHTIQLKAVANFANFYELAEEEKYGNFNK